MAVCCALLGVALVATPAQAAFPGQNGRIAFTGVDAQGNPIVAPTWGRITSTVTTARQIQLGVKYVF